MPSSFLYELRWRNLIAQCTDEDGLTKHLAEGDPASKRAYIGFDPTSDSLTIGNLVPIMLLARFQKCGHTPVVVMGGGTGLIGDPSGKSAERQLMTAERVAANVENQKRIFGRFLDFSARPGGEQPALLVNNLDWLGKITYLEALRDLGKFFSVNVMMQKDSVRERLHNRDQGISYTEFSYQILQAYDYLHLYERESVTLQMGATDQWGNIVAGLDLIAKRATPAGDAAARPAGEGELKTYQQVGDFLVAPSEAVNGGTPGSESRGTQASRAARAFGLTTPLITKADGTKFGKTESGAVWLTADRTSPYAYYQFWLNAMDADVPKFIRTYTLWDREETEAVIAEHEKNPGAREAHRRLARDATALLHGEAEAAHAENAAKALFSGEIATLPLATLLEVMANVPSSTHDKATLGAGVPVLDLLITTKLATSKREAREFLENGSVTLNGRKVALDDRATSSDLLHGQFIALRRGKKNWHLSKWA